MVGIYDSKLIARIKLPIWTSVIFGKYSYRKLNNWKTVPKEIVRQYQVKRYWRFK